MQGAIAKLAEDIVRSARNLDESIVAAESCTAGLLSQALADAPGAAGNFHGSFVAYTKEHKSRVLGVSPRLLREKGAVCREVAAAMAEGALLHSEADVSVAITGVAGPEADEDGNPVGLVCLAVARRGGDSRIEEKHYGALGRDAVRERAVADALAALRQFLQTPQAPRVTAAQPVRGD